MTSAKFDTIPISDITVSREDRQRTEIDDLEEMVDSLRRLGQINPITIRKDGELVTGERRYSAAKLLGWTHMTVQYIEDLDDITIHLIELEENIKRKDLSWEDEVAAVKKYHEMRKLQEKEWTIEKSAKELGMAKSNARERILVADAIESGNEKVKSAPKLSTAIAVATRANKRAKEAALEIVDAHTGVKKVPVSTPLINTTFAEFAENYDGPKFNFLHCDFPYGVGADGHDQNVNADLSFGTYEDSEEIYFNLLQDLRLAMPKIVSASAHLMFWFSMDYYTETFLNLTNMGWTVSPFPLVWHKSDNKGILPDHNRGPRRVYETAFMASRGDRLVAQAVSNLKAFPNEKEIHMSEKPEGMLEHFFRMFVDESTIMLDPTCGSGNAVKVAKRLGAQHYVGVERDTGFYGRACKNLDEEG